MSEDRALIVEFFQHVRQLYHKDELVKFLFVTKTGIVVGEGFSSKIVESYNQWLQTKSEKSSQYQDADIRRKLYLTPYPTPVYIVQGSTITVGFLIPCPTEQLRNAGMKLYEGIPLDTESNLHHKDPVFLEGKGIRCDQSRNGFTAVVERKGKSYYLPFGFIDTFKKWLISTEELRRDFPRKSQREIVKQFARVAGRIRNFPRKIPVLIPSKYRLQKDLDLSFLRGAIFVREKDSFVDVFAYKGKGLRNLMKDEINSSITQPNLRNLGPARIKNSPDGFLATVDIGGIIHKFGYSALFSFMEDIFHYTRANQFRLPGRLTTRFTVRDVLTQLAYLLNQAKPILAEKVPPSCLGDNVHNSVFLVAQNEWYFSVDRSKMIRSVYYSKRRPKRTLTLVNAPSATLETPSVPSS